MYNDWQKWSKKLTLLTLFACLTSGVLTFRGMLVFRTQGFFETFIQPLLLTILSVAGAITAWQFVFSKFPRATPKQRRSLLLISSVIVVFLLLTSTFFSAFGMSGDKAALRHMVSLTEEAEKNMGLLNRHRAAEAALVGPLQDMSRVFKSLTRREIKGGPLSGRRGPGTVSENIRGLEHGYADAADAMEEQGQKAERNYKRGSAILTDIRGTIGDEELTVEEKSRSVEASLAVLNGVFTKMEVSALPRVQSLVERMDELYLVGEGDAKMELALSRIKQSVSGSRESIIEKIDDLASGEKIVVRHYRVFDTFEAIYHYWPYVFPAFVYSLCADVLVPVMALLFLSFIANDFTQTQVGLPRKEDDNVETQPQRGNVTDLRIAERLKRIYRESKTTGQHRPRRGNGDRGQTIPS